MFRTVVICAAAAVLAVAAWWLIDAYAPWAHRPISGAAVLAAGEVAAIGLVGWMVNRAKRPN